MEGGHSEQHAIDAISSHFRGSDCAHRGKHTVLGITRQGNDWNMHRQTHRAQFQSTRSGVRVDGMTWYSGPGQAVCAHIPAQSPQGSRKWHPATTAFSHGCASRRRPLPAALRAHPKRSAMRPWSCRSSPWPKFTPPQAPALARTMPHKVKAKGAGPAQGPEAHSRTDLGTCVPRRGSMRGGGAEAPRALGSAARGRRRGVGGMAAGARHDGLEHAGDVGQ